jgi:hypothetical protein
LVALVSARNLTLKSVKIFGNQLLDKSNISWKTTSFPTRKKSESKCFGANIFLLFTTFIDCIILFMKFIVSFVLTQPISVGRVPWRAPSQRSRCPFPSWRLRRYRWAGPCTPISRSLVYRRFVFLFAVTSSFFFWKLCWNSKMVQILNLCKLKTVQIRIYSN